MNPVGRATAALAPFPALRRCASLVELRSAYACVVVAMRAPQQPSARQHRSSVHTAGRRAALAAQQHASRQPQAGRLHPRVDDAHPSMVAEGAGAAAGGGGASGQPAPLPRHPSDSTRYAPASAAPMQAGESAAASDAERSASPSAEAEQSSEVDGLNGAGSLAARDPYADVLHVDVMGSSTRCVEDIERAQRLHVTAMRRNAEWQAELLQGLDVPDTDALEEHWASCHVHSLEGEPMRALWLSVNTAPRDQAAPHAGAHADAEAPAGEQPALPADASHKLARLHPIHLLQRRPTRGDAARHATSVASPVDTLSTSSTSESDSDGDAQAGPRRHARPRSSVACHLGVVPVHDGLAAAGHLGHHLAVEVPEHSVHALRWSAQGSDHASGAWRSYLLLLSDTAAMQDEHILFPNQIRHRGRALYNATPSRVLRFLADPCLSEIARHAENIAAHAPAPARQAATTQLQSGAAPAQADSPEPRSIELMMLRWGPAVLQQVCMLGDRIEEQQRQLARSTPLT